MPLLSHEYDLWSREVCSRPVVRGLHALDRSTPPDYDGVLSIPPTRDSSEAVALVGSVSAPGFSPVDVLVWAASHIVFAESLSSSWQSRASGQAFFEVFLSGPSAATHARARVLLEDVRDLEGARSLLSSACAAAAEARVMARAGEKKRTTLRVKSELNERALLAEKVVSASAGECAQEPEDTPVALEVAPRQVSDPEKRGTPGIAGEVLVSCGHSPSDARGIPSIAGEALASRGSPSSAKEVLATPEEVPDAKVRGSLLSVRESCGGRVARESDVLASGREDTRTLDPLETLDQRCI